MANDVFDIKTDLSIRYYNASISSYVEIVADSFEVDIDRGIEVENGVFAKGSIGTATVKLVKSNLNDFLGTPGYKANDYIEIRYRGLPDSFPSNYAYLFTGYIQNVSMNYVNESGTLQIEIVANDVMKTFLNTQIASFAISGTTTQRNYANCLINLNTAINASVTWPPLFPSGITLTNAGTVGTSSTVQRVSPTFLNIVSGSLVDQYVNAELGWIWSAYTPNVVKYFTRTDVNAARNTAWNSSSATVSNVHYTNLITNGTFEVNTTGWSPSTNVALTRDTTQFYSGVASMDAQSNAVTSAAYAFQTNTTMTAIPLSKYKASGWFRADFNTSNARVQLAFINSSGTTIQLDSAPFTTITNTGWTQIAVTGVAPTGTVRAELRVQANKVNANLAALFIDNAKLENLTNISTNHYCLDNIVLKYNSDTLVNKVKVTEALTATPATASNTASITANGEQTGQYNVEYDVSGSPTTLGNLATRIANAATIKQIEQVTVPVIRDDGKASFIPGYDVGSPLQVEFAQDPLPALQVVSLISRINHNITPQHWEMNIGLWRAI